MKSHWVYCPKCKQHCRCSRKETLSMCPNTDCKAIFHPFEETISICINKDCKFKLSHPIGARIIQCPKCLALMDVSSKNIRRCKFMGVLDNAPIIQVSNNTGLTFRDNDNPSNENQTKQSQKNTNESNENRISDINTTKNHNNDNNNNNNTQNNNCSGDNIDDINNINGKMKDKSKYNPITGFNGDCFDVNNFIVKEIPNVGQESLIRFIPEPLKTAFDFFFKERYSIVKEKSIIDCKFTNYNVKTVIAMRLKQEWIQLEKSKRQRYIMLSRMDGQRYNNEMRQYYEMKRKLTNIKDTNSNTGKSKSENKSESGGKTNMNNNNNNNNEKSESKSDDNSNGVKIPDFLFKRLENAKQAKFRCLCDCHVNKFDIDTLNLIESIVESPNIANSNNCNVECFLCHCTLNIGQIYQKQKKSKAMVRNWEKMQKELFAENVKDPDYKAESDIDEDQDDDIEY